MITSKPFSCIWGLIAIADDIIVGHAGLSMTVWPMRSMPSFSQTDTSWWLLERMQMCHQQVRDVSSSYSAA